MPLTINERDFLAAFIHEAVTDPFKGPATDLLHRKGIYYDDVLHLMTAYYREHAPDQEGLGGKHDSDPPPPPWPDRQSVMRRDQELKQELALSQEDSEPVKISL